MSKHTARLALFAAVLTCFPGCGDEGTKSDGTAGEGNVDGSGGAASGGAATGGAAIGNEAGSGAATGGQAGGGAATGGQAGGGAATGGQATGGEAGGGAETGGAASGGAATGGVEAGGAETGGAETGGESAKERIGDDVFNEDEVESYYLTFSDEEYAKLMDLSTLLLDQWTVNEDRYVQAALRVGDQELPSIGVRFKGDYSIWGCVDAERGERRVRVDPLFGDIDVCQRFSLKLDFDRYDDSSRVDGLKKLNLHAMSADPSKLRERLGYSLFRDMDIVAPRMVHARVYINEEYHGLFAAVEQIDGRFTANRFPASGDGNLYKQIWPFAHITSDDAKEVLKTNDDPDIVDVSDFLAFRDAVVGSIEADFATRMAPHIDFDYLARYIVVDRATNNYDGLMLFWQSDGHDYNHNYYWYHDSESGRWVLIPWDLDKTFWYPEPIFWTDNAPNGDYVVPNWNVITSSCQRYRTTFDSLGYEWSVRPIDCDPFMKLLRGQIYGSQKAIADAFIAGVFSEQSVKAKFDVWRAQIADAVEEDSLVDSTHWQSAVDELLADLPNFHDNLSLMMSGLIEQ